jgi:hypothetical protein
LDLKELKEILQILDEKQIAEFELEEQGMKLRIRKAAAAPASVAPALLAPLVPRGAARRRTRRRPRPPRRRTRPRPPPPRTTACSW